ncbi:MAG: pentapeptide repeat-containing protein [Thermodesulfobacteriota bacterium]
MHYRPEDLHKLRQRWQQPLLDPDSGQPVEVEGCRTFHDLLRRRLQEIEALGQPASPADRSLPVWRTERRAFWEQQGQPRFLGLLAELTRFGLPAVTGIEAARYEIREPCDLRGADLHAVALDGAFLENAHFEGADLTGARLAGARCFETHFEDAVCEQASFLGAECHFAAFHRARCDRALFDQADCTMARFDQARLRHASFDTTIAYAATFDGAFLAKAALAAMRVNHLTRFGCPGEHLEARARKAVRREKRHEGDDWYIVDLFPVWLRAAEVNSQIRALLKAHGYFLAADEYQYLEMVCRRHVLHQNRASEVLEWLLKDLMFGYGLKWKRPLVTVFAIIGLWGLGFAGHFRLHALHDYGASIGWGMYYSVIAFTTLGFGNAPDLDGLWPKVLLCSEALLGTILMPMFLLAYARKILQD